MNIDFEEFKVQGIKFNYYFICKRKLWLFHNGISMESTSDRVAQGKVVHENSYMRKEKSKEKLIDSMIKIDIIEGNEIREVKISSKMMDSDRMQLLYYLYYLRKSGIEKVGTLNYVNEKKVEKVILDGNGERQVEEALIGIRKILSLEFPPPVCSYKYCKSCSYYEYCYIGEEY